MADAAAIARRAIELATSHLEADIKEIADLAQGDLRVLPEAAEIVHNQAKPNDKASHLAFILITTTYDSLRGKPA